MASWLKFFQEQASFNLNLEIADKGELEYKLDGIVLDIREIATEPRWEKSSVIENSKTIKLIIEVVSTNWRDDYHTKFAAYESLGIPEYWIVDYAALGGRRFLAIRSRRHFGFAN